ncbi:MULTISPECIES: deoxynucleoside kinase [Bacillus]|uniref:Deoxyguanosine kinase n=12 Tax=Bacillus cereus group TaxID=86661 RepID=A0A1T3UH87_BACAN|nr:MULTISPECIES: deoxynucleoside kinase [Bacillus]ADY19269.1 deoxynucleoside kinase family protein [Bacillus thuringiensis serovar finitimus YBT-020]EDX54965.1 deoxynucleoside kinase family protein [Bacillus cereus W]EDX65850.1 deoxynucleoside kinase family protein [Bacillus cereus NVH0597-99]EEL47855.1 Deoxyguanosine kinase [Bacillus cereus Rock3-42]EJT17526.1 deoxyguanosine kinase [Bacillus anthracis str. UR-1]MDA1587317.1 deoxynucleoside kinase [Bacillus cereus group sp. TH230-1LC]OON5301
MTGVPFITVEGPIGVGKTSLAKEISTHMQLHLLKEIVDENPFLGKFYEDIDEWSFQTEMFFLCNRYKQLEDINIKYLNQRKPVVADYHIFKNVIFASRTLKDSQYDKYMQIYRILTQDMPVPNVIVYLTASLETLQRRIAMRGREFEKNMDPNYLLQLTKDYETAMDAFKKDHPDIPVLKFNGDDMDFVKNPDDLNVILSALQNTLLKESK